MGTLRVPPRGRGRGKETLAHSAGARSGAGWLGTARFPSHLYVRGHLSVTPTLHGKVLGQSYLLSLPGTRHVEKL